MHGGKFEQILLFSIWFLKWTVVDSFGRRRKRREMRSCIYYGTTVAVGLTLFLFDLPEITCCHGKRNANIAEHRVINISLYDFPPSRPDRIIQDFTLRSVLERRFRSTPRNIILFRNSREANIRSACALCYGTQLRFMVHAERVLMHV